MDNYTGKRIFLENDPVVDIYKKFGNIQKLEESGEQPNV